MNGQEPQALPQEPAEEPSQAPAVAEAGEPAEAGVPEAAQAQAQAQEPVGAETSAPAQVRIEAEEPAAVEITSPAQSAPEVAAPVQARAEVQEPAPAETTAPAPAQELEQAPTRAEARSEPQEQAQPRSREQRQQGAQQGRAQKPGKGQQAQEPAARGEDSAAAAPPAPAASGDGRRNGKSRPKPEDAYVPRLKEKYLKEVVPAMVKEFEYSNAMQTPQVKKVVINIGMGGEARENAKALDNAVGDIGTITGQKAVITRAKKSIASFKLRTGMPIGVMVTLRSNRMYEFLDRLVNVALPRVRDFSGVSSSSFDGHGNFSLGLREQLIFPEIDYDKIDRIRGMEVVIVTSAKTDQEGRRLLELMGMPFKRPQR